MSERQYKIIILRHGQSEWNKTNKFCGWVDIPLSDTGKQQLVKSAQLIKDNTDLRPKSCFTSRLTRSCQTANIILEELNEQYLNIYRSWRLNERHYGKLQGQTKSTVLKQFGEEKYMYWRRAYEGCPPPVELDDEYSSVNDERYKIDTDIDFEKLPRCESLKLVLERLLPYYTSTIQPELVSHDTILVVTHGSVVRALIKHIYKINDEDIVHINIPNGIPMVITLDTSFEPVGNYYYLDPEIAKIELAKVAKQGFEEH